MASAEIERRATRFKLKAQRRASEEIGAAFRRKAERWFGLPSGQLRSPLSHRVSSYPRALLMWVFRQDLAWSYPRIGHEFKRDHSTVITAVRKVDGWLHPPSQEVLHDLESLRAILKNVTTTDASDRLGEPAAGLACSFCGQVPNEKTNIVQNDDPARPVAICEPCLMTALDAILQKGS